MKFWRERERENKEQILAPLCGQVRVLVVGDSGKFHKCSTFITKLYGTKPNVNRYHPSLVLWNRVLWEVQIDAIPDHL